MDQWLLRAYGLPLVPESRCRELFDEWESRVERAAMEAWDRLIEETTGQPGRGWLDGDLPRLSMDSPGLLAEVRAHAERLWCREVGNEILMREAESARG